jgi:hypothetical protein
MYICVTFRGVGSDVYLQLEQCLYSIVNLDRLAQSLGAAIPRVALTPEQAAQAAHFEIQDSDVEHRACEFAV